MYLLRPEEPREIELKDFTIMKPKNNKMHRVLRFYPRCQISYQAAPPPPLPEEREVTSPGGTTTTTVVVADRTPRHYGGFSNPSRNAEVFRLKRRLLKEYYDSIQDDDREAAMFDALIGRSAHPSQQPTWASNSVYDDRFETSVEQPRVRQPLPKYTPVAVGDEDTIPLTSERETSMSLEERVQYVSSLWPSLAPIDEDDQIMNYYGIEVQIISEEEREKELAAADGEALSSSGKQEEENAVTETTAEITEDSGAIEETKEEDPVASSSETAARDVPSSPELSVETRSAALQKLKEATAQDDDDELKLNPIATKQDDWVQCDKCQKWRRLPNQVNVSELPAVWYCKMNRWDKRHNKCSAPEEKLVVLMKGADLVEYRQRKFAQDYIHRIKRMEKSVHHYKYTHAHDDDGERKFVQCTECLKLRPLIGGMDPNKVAEPFVCWMNWDELLASCSAPQGPLYPRSKSETRYNSGPAAPLNAFGDDVKPKARNSIASGANEGAIGRGKGKRGKRKGNEKGSTGSNGGNGGKKLKRRVA